MKIFHPDSFYRAFFKLLQLEGTVANLYKDKGAKEKLSQDHADSARLTISDFLGECERAELNRALERAEGLKHFGELRVDQSTSEEVRNELRELGKAVHLDLRKRIFLYL